MSHTTCMSVIRGKRKTNAIRLTLILITPPTALRWSPRTIANSIGARRLVLQKDVAYLHKVRQFLRGRYHKINPNKCRITRRANELENYFITRCRNSKSFFSKGVVVLRPSAIVKASLFGGISEGSRVEVYRFASTDPTSPMTQSGHSASRVNSFITD